MPQSARHAPGQQGRSYRRRSSHDLWARPKGANNPFLISFFCPPFCFCVAATRGRIRCRSPSHLDGRYPSVRFGRVPRPPLAGGPPELSGTDAGYRVASCIGIRSSGGSAGRLQSRGSGGTFGGGVVVQLSRVISHQPPSPVQSAPPRSCPVCRCRAHAVLPCREGPRLMCSVKGLYRRDMRVFRVHLRPRLSKRLSCRPSCRGSIDLLSPCRFPCRRPWVRPL